MRTHLAEHTARKVAGLAMALEALRMMERFYPEGLARVYFYRPSAPFRLVFAIFRLWVQKSTRERFVLVREGDEAKFFFDGGANAATGLGLRRDQIPSSFGGSGPPLDGDRFLLRACEAYDRTARR